MLFFLSHFSQNNSAQTAIKQLLQIRALFTKILIILEALIKRVGVNGKAHVLLCEVASQRHDIHVLLGPRLAAHCCEGGYVERSVHVVYRAHIPASSDKKVVTLSVAFVKNRNLWLVGRR